MPWVCVGWQGFEGLGRELGPRLRQAPPCTRRRRGPVPCACASPLVASPLGCPAVPHQRLLLRRWPSPLLWSPLPPALAASQPCQPLAPGCQLQRHLDVLDLRLRLRQMRCCSPHACMRLPAPHAVRSGVAGWRPRLPLCPWRPDHCSLVPLSTSTDAIAPAVSSRGVVELTRAAALGARRSSRRCVALQKRGPAPASTATRRACPAPADEVVRALPPVRCAAPAQAAGD